MHLKSEHFNYKKTKKNSLASISQIPSFFQCISLIYFPHLHLHRITLLSYQYILRPTYLHFYALTLDTSVHFYLNTFAKVHLWFTLEFIWHCYIWMHLTLQSHLHLNTFDTAVTFTFGRVWNWCRILIWTYFSAFPILPDKIMVINGNYELHGVQNISNLFDPFKHYTPE